MNYDLPLRFRVGFALASIVLIASLSIVAINYGNGYFNEGYELIAVFDSSTQGLDTQSDVKLRGINVGHVERIDLRPDGRAEVTLFIDQGNRIPDSAVGSIEPLSIFGPKFIRLAPGDHELTGPYLEPNDELAETTPPVEFTQVLGNATRLLEEIDPAELVTIIRTVADGVSGLGPEIASLLEDTQALVDVAARHTPEQRQFLADLAALATTLADHGDELGELLDGVTRVASGVSGLLDAHRADLEVTLTALFAVGDVLYAERDHIIELVGSLDTFFGTLSDIIRIPGPHNTVIGALGGPVPDDPCSLFDPCPFDLGLSADASPTERILGALFPGGAP